MPATLARPAVSYRPGEAGGAIKPHPWPVQRRFISPEWRWIWDFSLQRLFPFWGGIRDTAYDISGRGGDATIDPVDVSWVSGRLGTMLKNDTATTGNKLDLGTLPISDWTEITYWVQFRMTATNNFSRIVSIQHTGNDDIRLWHDQANNELKAAFDDGVVDEVSTAFTDTADFHVAVVSHDGSEIVFWLDQKLVGSVASTFDFAGAAGVGRLFQISGTASDGSSSFLGEITTFGVMDRALTQVSQMRRIATGPFAPFRMWHPVWGATPFQFLRPASDISNPGGWQNELGGTTDLWQSIDEETPDAADFVESPA